MILGLVAAKETSNRFPGKNKFIHNGEPLFWHSVKPLLDSKLVDDVYVITDSKYIKKYCQERRVDVIWRPKNATRSEDKLISVLRYGYYNLDKPYDLIVSVMANCPGHTAEDIDSGIYKIERNNLKEIRSFDSNGIENGVMILTKSIIESNYDLSYYIGSIKTEAKEIHYKKDLR